MKKRLLAVLMSMVMVMGLAGCGSDSGDGKDTSSANKESSSSAGDAGSEGGDSNGKITIGFSQVGAESDWRTANTASMKETFSDANGYNLIFDDAQQKQENQLTAIRNFIQQEVDYIVLAPTTESGWDQVLQEAKDAEIPVIIVDREVKVSNEDLYTAWVGSNFELEGKKAAAWLKAYGEATKKDSYKIVDIQGNIGASAQIGRTNGLNAAIEDKENNWELLEAQTGEFTQAKGQEVMESMLKKHDNIEVVYCENDNMAFGAIDAIETAGKKVGPDGDMLILSFDTTNAGLTKVLEGKIILNTECNPLHGPRVKEIIDQLEAGQTPEKKQYVDEEIFAGTDEVKSVTVDGTEYPVTVVTQEIIDSRAY